MDILIDYEVFRKRLRQLIDSRSATVQDVCYELNITPATMVWSQNTGSRISYSTVKIF